MIILRLRRKMNCPTLCARHKMGQLKSTALSTALRSRPVSSAILPAFRGSPAFFIASSICSFSAICCYGFPGLLAELYFGNLLLDITKDGTAMYGPDHNTILLLRQHRATRGLRLCTSSACIFSVIAHKFSLPGVSPPASNLCTLTKTWRAQS